MKAVWHDCQNKQQKASKCLPMVFPGVHFISRCLKNGYLRMLVYYSFHHCSMVYSIFYQLDCYEWLDCTCLLTLEIVHRLCHKISLCQRGVTILRSTWIFYTYMLIGYKLVFGGFPRSQWVLVSHWGYSVYVLAFLNS